MKYQKYDKYKDSEIDWLGEVPEHWDVVKLGHFTKWRSGNFLSNEFIQKEKDGLNTIPVIGGNGVSGWTDKFFENRELIIIGRVGALCGNIHLIRNKTWITDNALYSFWHKDFYLVFLSHFLRFLDINRFSSQTAQPLITGTQISNLRVLLPPKNEQFEITNFLNRETTYIDTLIEKKQNLIDLLKEKRTALITKAVTKGLNPDVKMKDSGIEWLGEIPEHWEVKKLKFISSINDETLAETTQEDYEIKYVDIGSIDPNYGITNKQEMIFAEAPSRARRKVKDGDVIVSTVRTYLRAIAPIIKPEQNLIVSTGFAVIRPRKVTSRFLEYALRGVYFVEKIVSLSVGVSYPAINSSTLSNIYIAFPPTNEEQLMISNYLKENIDEIDRITNKVSEAINKHREYRTAIISAAVTGKIKVTQD